LPAVAASPTKPTTSRPSSETGAISHVKPVVNAKLISAQDALATVSARLAVASVKQDQALADYKNAQEKVLTASKNMDDLTARQKVEREKRMADYTAARDQISAKHSTALNEYGLKLKKVNTWSPMAMSRLNNLEANQNITNMSYDRQIKQMEDERDRVQNKEWAEHGLAGTVLALAVAARKHKWSGSITSAFWTQIICNYRRCRAQIDCERTQIICDGTANINQWAQIH